MFKKYVCQTLEVVIFFSLECLLTISQKFTILLSLTVAPQTIKAITKQVSISRLRAAGIRAIIRIGKYQYNLRFD